jgi:hypothetical protein
MVAGDTVDAIRFDSSNNIITNSGAIATSGLQSEGMTRTGSEQYAAE